MKGNNNSRDESFSKVKYSIPSFRGAYDGDAYFDWVTTVEQEFNSHLVPEIHRVRQVTTEFKSFAFIWWYELGRTHSQPETWDGLKDTMRARFVPPSYKPDPRKVLQRLTQGSRTVLRYYIEFKTCLLRCDLYECDEAIENRFLRGLKQEIQDLLMHEIYCSLHQLFRHACATEKQITKDLTKIKNLNC